MRRKIMIAGLIVVFVVMFYGLGVFVFLGHAGFRTYVNGTSVFMDTPEEIVLDIAKSVDNQLFTLIRRDGTTESISFGNLGILLKHPIYPSDFSSNPFLWITTPFHRTDFTYDMELEPVVSQIEKNVNRLECMSESYIQKPTDGYVKLNEDGTYTVVSDSSGNEIDKDKLVNAIVDAIMNHTLTLNLEEAGVYKEDLIRQRDLDVKSECSLDVLMNLKLSVNLGAGTTVDIPFEVIQNAVYELDGVNYVHYPSMYAYAAYLARYYNTVGMERQFVTTNGVNLTFQPADSDTFYGWELNQNATAKAICKQLASGESDVITASWKSIGGGHTGKNDFGDTYVELSIQDQHMWCYVDGDLLFDTDVTTGTDSIPNHRTPTGMFMTMDWNTEYTMHGSYGTAFSHYFIRLTPQGVGIHDASWRSVYGGTEYLNNGSHGCINTPYDKVKLFYDTLYPRGSYHVPVIIY